MTASGRAHAEPGWSIRAFRSGDETALVELFAAVFGRRLTPEAWRWKLKGRPSPVENVWVAVTDDGGRVIGQYAGIPVAMRLAGRVRWAMQSVDTMVSPDFRRRGILTGLGKATYARWCDGGVAAVFGVPNQNWGTRTDALGLRPLFKLRWMRAPLRAGRALARSVTLPPPVARAVASVGDALNDVWTGAVRSLHRRPRGVRVDALTASGSELGALWSGVSARFPNAVVRDPAWVRWRYVDAPGTPHTVLVAHANGEPAGYVAYRLDEDGDRRAGLVSDLLTAPGSRAAAWALIDAALEDLRGRGAETVRTATAPAGPLHRTLRRAGFIAGAGSSQLLLAPLAADLDIDSLTRPETWLLAPGDFDVV